VPPDLLRPLSSITAALALWYAILAPAGEARAAASDARLGPAELGVVVNDADPASVQIATYYAAARRIPPGNVVHVRFDPSNTLLSRDEFARIRAAVLAATPPQVQGYALTWTSPYRVDCMSITTAFAFGFDPAFCSASRCATTRSSPLYDYLTHHPWSDLQVRPTMVLAGASVDEVRRLIDRGVASDGTHPKGTAYLVITSDRARMSRLPQYSVAIETLKGRLRFAVAQGEYIENRDDVMFYFTGAASVQGIKTLKFRPGAVADHLTSWGGKLTDSEQMSALRWLEAGATGSYGTVVEPCSYPAKFPNVATFLRNYLAGDTLLEAYWRSVEWPGEGIFVGEPLAAPYRGKAKGAARNSAAR
jgi:uncharacterized protein (TIGR03790 family)